MNSSEILKDVGNGIARVDTGVMLIETIICENIITRDGFIEVFTIENINV